MSLLQSRYPRLSGGFYSGQVKLKSLPMLLPPPNPWLYAPVTGSSRCAGASAPQGVGTLCPWVASGTTVRPRVLGPLGPKA